jgi:hypothetical protein
VSAVDEIAAAISKLEASKPNLKACPEFNYSAMRHVARNVDMEHDCTNADEDCGWERYDTAPAFDMLIRTVEAQIGLLAYSIRRVEMGASPDDFPSTYALALARAINGATS